VLIVDEKEYLILVMFAFGIMFRFIEYEIEKEKGDECGRNERY
jgi:hypothetical protein